MQNIDTSNILWNNINHVFPSYGYLDIAPAPLQKWTCHIEPQETSMFKIHPSVMPRFHRREYPYGTMVQHVRISLEKLFLSSEPASIHGFVGELPGNFTHAATCDCVVLVSPIRVVLFSFLLPNVSPSNRPVRHAPDRSIRLPDRPRSLENLGPVCFS